MRHYRLGMPFREKYLRTPGALYVAGRHVQRCHVTSTDSEIPGYLADTLAGTTVGWPR
jgi:hypothetical protein